MSLFSQLAGLSKQLSLEYTPPIARYIVLPLQVSPDVDEHLVQITEGRLPIFSAECVPDYLRTKPDPAMESRMNLHEAKANALTNEAAAKQVAQYTKIVSHVYDLIAKAREDWEIDSMNRNMQMSTFSLQDTQVRNHQIQKEFILIVFFFFRHL
jgi:mediator of RNA polymerase II transcription subunit 8